MNAQLQNSFNHNNKQNGCVIGGRGGSGNGGGSNNGGGGGGGGGSGGNKNNYPPPQPCPRCNSENTRFCYYNNYSISQPRFFCMNCKRYWTQGGSLRNSGSRMNKLRKRTFEMTFGSMSPMFHSMHQSQARDWSLMAWTNNNTFPNNRIIVSKQSTEVMLRRGLTSTLQERVLSLCNMSTIRDIGGPASSSIRARRNLIPPSPPPTFQEIERDDDIGDQSTPWGEYKKINKFDEP